MYGTDQYGLQKSKYKSQNRNIMTQPKNITGYALKKATFRNEASYGP